MICQDRQAEKNANNFSQNDENRGCINKISVAVEITFGGGGGGFTRPIPRDGSADQFRGIPIVGRLPMDGTRGPEEKGCGRKWPDAEGLVQGSRARDVRDSEVQYHSCCKKESRLDQPCGDKELRRVLCPLQRRRERAQRAERGRVSSSGDTVGIWW